MHVRTSPSAARRRRHRSASTPRGHGPEPMDLVRRPLRAPLMARSERSACADQRCATSSARAADGGTGAQRRACPVPSELYGPHYPQRDDSVSPPERGGPTSGARTPRRPARPARPAPGAIRAAAGQRSIALPPSSAAAGVPASVLADELAWSGDASRLIADALRTEERRHVDATARGTAHRPAGWPAESSAERVVDRRADADRFGSPTSRTSTRDSTSTPGDPRRPSAMAASASTRSDPRLERRRAPLALDDRRIRSIDAARRSAPDGSRATALEQMLATTLDRSTGRIGLPTDPAEPSRAAPSPSLRDLPPPTGTTPGRRRPTSAREAGGIPGMTVSGTGQSRTETSRDHRGLQDSVRPRDPAPRLTGRGRPSSWRRGPAAGCRTLTTSQLDVGERGAQQREVVVVGRVVRPQREDPAGPQPPGQPAYAVLGVERRVARVQEVPRRVVDVDDDGVEQSPGLRCRPSRRRPTGRRSRRARAGTAASLDDETLTGTRPRSCQPMTASSASTTTSERTRGSSSTVCAV